MLVKCLFYPGVKQTQKGSLHDQVIGNEGVEGTMEKPLQKVRMVSCRKTVSSIQKKNYHQNREITYCHIAFPIALLS